MDLYFFTVAFWVCAVNKMCGRQILRPHWLEWKVLHPPMPADIRTDVWHVRLKRITSGHAAYCYVDAHVREQHHAIVRAWLRPCRCVLDLPANCRREYVVILECMRATCSVVWVQATSMKHPCQLCSGNLARDVCLASWCAP